MTVKELIIKLEKLPQDKQVDIIANYFCGENARSTAKEVSYSDVYDKVFIKGWDGVYL